MTKEEIFEKTCGTDTYGRVQGYADTAKAACKLSRTPGALTKVEVYAPENAFDYPEPAKKKVPIQKPPPKGRALSQFNFNAQNFGVNQVTTAVNTPPMSALSCVLRNPSPPRVVTRRARANAAAD